MLGDSADLRLAVRSENLELHVAATGEGAPGPLYDESNIPISVRDVEPGNEFLSARPVMTGSVLLGLHAGPSLPNISDDISWRGADLQLLQAAGETTRVATERSVEVENLSLRIVQNDHIERSRRAADVSSAAIRVLLRFEDVLR